jgi:hypothetical protein
VQFRLPDGSRVVRRFNRSGTVAQLYLHIAFRLKLRHVLSCSGSGTAQAATTGVVPLGGDGDAGGDFDLCMPPSRKTLLADVARSLLDAGVCNATVTVST